MAKCRENMEQQAKALKESETGEFQTSISADGIKEVSKAIVTPITTMDAGLQVSYTFLSLLWLVSAILGYFGP